MNDGSSILATRELKLHRFQVVRDLQLPRNSPHVRKFVNRNQLGNFQQSSKSRFLALTAKMWRSLGILLLVGLTLADKPEPAYKGAKVKSVAPEKVAKTPVDLKASASKQTPAQDRQDTYGSPAAPAVDTYGSPVAPVQDSYGSPQADPQGPAPVQGEVGTQGYYYYYYPVANSYTPSQTYQSSGGHKSPASSSGGGLFGGGLGLLLLLGIGILIVGAIVLASFSNSNRRSFNDYISPMDMDDLAYKVYEAIEYFSA